MKSHRKNQNRAWNPHLGNIFTVYARADSHDVVEGKAAYWSYHDGLAEIANRFSYDRHVVFGVFAALSPNSSYLTNVRSTLSVLHAVRGGDSYESARVSTYSANKTKAWKIASNVHHDPLVYLSGPKVVSFYRNILDPEDRDHITIDGHMYNVWAGRGPVNLNTVPPIDHNTYNEIASDFQTVSQHLKLVPNQLQAICWLVWKRVNRIDYKTELLQPDLFGTGQTHMAYAFS